MKYLYYINYREYQKEICLLEIECLFGFHPESKYFFHSTFINPSRSIFIKYAVKVEYMEDSIDKIESLIESNELTLDDYKIQYKEISHVSYEESIEARRSLGTAIEGDFSMSNPIDEYCLTKVESVWVFGRFYENDYTYKARTKKPHNYSFALDVWLAKTLTNIAVGNDLSLDVYDPCCGVGTVLIEGRVNGLNIKGSDLNWKIVKASNYNLEHFGFKGDSTCKNIDDITLKYDVAIVDLPYGKFVTEHKKLSKSIIETAIKITDKVVFVSMEPLNINGVVKQVEVKKREGFSRFVTIYKTP